MQLNGWWKECCQLALLFLLAGGLGWYFGEPLAGLLVAALTQTVYWLYHLWRMAQWLRLPESEPPDASGIWGELFDRVYHIKQHDLEERDRLQTAVSYLRDSLAALKDGAVLVDPRGGVEWSNEAASRLLDLEYPRDRHQSILKLVRSEAFKEYFAGGDYRMPLVVESPINPDLRLQFEITLFGRGSRLVFARDMTREVLVEKMRRDFVANVSHELRTPLTVITGYLHNLDNLDATEDGMARPLAQMRQQAEHMETLLRDLLWLAQIESAEGQEEYSNVNMAELLNEVCQSVGVTYPDRKLDLRLSCSDFVRGDYRQIYSAVSNLIVNAFKYGEGDVVVEWRRGENGLCLCVTDQGPGIEEHHVPRLTERFYRVDKSRSKETGGTGLGLAIVKHVLMAHGAGLEIDSQVGVGSTFRCVFPVPTTRVASL